jgi:hypothetical protein
MDDGDEIDATLMQVSGSIYFDVCFSKSYNSKEDAAQCELVDWFSLHRDTASALKLKIPSQFLPHNLNFTNDLIGIKISIVFLVVL